MYKDCKIYGPYEHSDYTGRMFDIISYADGTKETTTNARYVWETTYNVKLKKQETVDHIDGNCSNDSLDNLQLLSLSDNAKKSAVLAKYLEFECAVCGSDFEILERTYRRNQITLKKDGPYCSKKCAGKVHH